MRDRATRMAALSAEKRTLLVRRLAALSQVPCGPTRLPRRIGVNVFPTSFAQERVWFLEQVVPGGPAYNVAGAFTAQGRLDVEALRRALATVTARHESLRTTFVAMDGRPLQVVSPVAPVSLVVRDLRAVPVAEAVIGERARAEVHREIERPFDVGRGPLLRVRVLVTGAEAQIVCLTMHHLVTDAWSMTILVRELADAYREAVAGRVSAPRAPGLQYPDYSEWQRGRCDGPRRRALEAYWRGRLTGADYPPVARGDRLAFRGAAERADVPPALATAMRALARRSGVTPFVVALAAWKIVLAHWNRLDDVTVISPVANRERSELADVVGFFVNLVALRTRLGDDPSFAELLQRVHQAVQGALGHQELPFELVLTALDVDRTLARPPLSPFAFAMERSVDAAIELPDLVLTRLPLETTTARTDLALVLVEDGQDLSMRLEYQRELYAVRDVAGLLRDFRACLARTVQEPALRVASALASDSRLVRAGEAGEGATVWTRFVAQACRTPEAVAVRARGRAMTYASLLAAASAAAAHLAAAGAGRDRVVAVWGERGPGWVQALLGIWGCGAVYLPLDPRWPAARIVDVLHRSDARMVVVDGEVPNVLSSLSRGVPWSIERLDRMLLDAATDGRVTPPDPSDVAYVLFTSGSTGAPKGALIEHAGLANHVQAKLALLGLGGADRVGQTAAASFDVSLWQCVAPLLVGGEAVIVDDSVTTDPEALGAAVADARLTILEVVPSVLRSILEGGAAAAARFTSLRWLVVTGEALAPSLCRRWLACHPRVPLVNAYGPTECADDVTHHVVRLAPSADAAWVPIGVPIPGMAVHVLDERLQPVPVGDPGEICVSGVGVGRGYLGDPERTAAAFVCPRRDDGSRGPRLYRTGDRGRVLPDGTLEWLGRLDAQVKLRGVRVEPTEVEAALSTHPDVRQAVVVAEPVDAPARLVAWVVADAGTPDLEATLRHHVAERLPEAMVPSAVMQVDALPVDGNGKIDRRALASGMVAVRDAQTPAVARFATPHPPVTAAERVLMALFAEVLGVEVRSTTDRFFALGGDSLSSIRLVAAARRAGLVLTPQQVFEHQTVAALAIAARAATTAVAEQEVVTGEVELTPIQRLFLSADLGGLHHYNMAAMLAVDGRLSATAVAVAVEHLLRHHDALRLRVRREGARWRQTIVGLEGAVPHTHVDLADRDDDAASTAIVATATEAQASLDLEHGPVLRVVSFDLGAQRPSRLLLVVHHLACDAASWPILLDDLAAVVTQVERGDPIALPPKTTSYRSWAARLAAHSRSGARRCELPFWERECAAPGACLPHVGAERRPEVADAAVFSSVLPSDATTRLLAVTAAMSVTVEAALLTGLATAVTAPATDDAMLVYLERHGRAPLFADVDVSRTVGWFTAVCPVRVAVAAGRRPSDTLLLVDRHLRALPDGGVGWGILAYGTDAPVVEVAGGASARPVVSCNFLGRIDPPPWPGWRVAPESPGAEVGVRGTRPTTLDVVAYLTGSRMCVDWHYDARAHAGDAIADVAAVCLGVLEQLADEEAPS